MSGIIVVGAGIAGSATALALHKAGFEVTVHEAHPHGGADIGAFLTLASNGLRALAQVDAAEPVAAAGFELTSMRVLGADGAELAQVPLGEPEDPLTRYRCLPRATLAAVLRQEVVRRGITIRHGARLVSVDETGDGVTARFADGTSVSGELLVGADGLHSTVRAFVAPGASPAYAGQSVYYGHTTAARPPSAAGRITMVRGSGAAFGYAVSPAGETFWFARVSGPALTREQIAATTAGQWRARLLPLLREDRTPAADIVAATTERLMATNATQLSPGLRWRGRRTVLVGDAAHAASPATGQGASMALEDAVVLAKALRDSYAGSPSGAGRGAGSAGSGPGAVGPGAAGTEPAGHGGASAGPGSTSAGPSGGDRSASGAGVGWVEAALARYEAHRRPRAERNTAASAQLTAARAGGQAPASAAAPPPGRPAVRVDETLRRVLDWATPLPDVPPEA